MTVTVTHVYDYLDRVKLSVTFTNVSGVAVDPSTVAVKWRDPSGNTTTKTYGVDAVVTKTGTGVYEVIMDIDEQGKWYYRWEGTGATGAQGAAERSFEVRDSMFY